MAWTLYNDITDWKLLPIDYVDLEFTSNQYTFYKNINVSTAKIKCILEPTDTGGQKTVGYELLIECVPVQNRLQEYRQLLIDIKNENPDITLVLSEDSSTKPMVTVRTDDSDVAFDDWSGWWETDSQTDTEFKLILRCIASPDLVDEGPPYLFTDTNM